ncbi:MAG: hypothetical protein IJM25_00685 [Eubacterium sp.]|nr:hypothetical protein [Eubacterium sp.]
MNIVQCRYGHFFDNDVFLECPHCAKPADAPSPSSFGGGDEEFQTVLIGREDAVTVAAPRGMDLSDGFRDVSVKSGVHSKRPDPDAIPQRRPGMPHVAVPAGHSVPGTSVPPVAEPAGGSKPAEASASVKKSNEAAPSTNPKVPPMAAPAPETGSTVLPITASLPETGSKVPPMAAPAPETGSKVPPMATPAHVATSESVFAATPTTNSYLGTPAKAEEDEQAEVNTTVLFSVHEVAPSGRTYGEENILRSQQLNALGREYQEKNKHEKKRGLIVGWLIGVTGADYGNFYPLYTDDNWVGKDKDDRLHVGSYKDSFASVNCVISFDMQGKEFYFNDEIFIEHRDPDPIYVDGKQITNTIYLNDQDILEIRGIQYQLIKLCKDGFSWWKEKKKTGRTEMLTLDDVMKSEPEDDYWMCPICSSKNHKIQRYCLTCGRSRV